MKATTAWTVRVWILRRNTLFSIVCNEKHSDARLRHTVTNMISTLRELSELWEVIEKMMQGIKLAKMKDERKRRLEDRN